MAVDRVLKDIMQLCANVQDGFWQAAAQARQPELAALLQANALEWNGFADEIFPVLLSVDHTSPEAKWKADLNRDWMNPSVHPNSMDDLAVCDDCLRGLSVAKNQLEASVALAAPQIRDILRRQRENVDRQMAALARFVQDLDHRPV